MPSTVVVLEVHVLTEDATWGQWCPHCALPSAAVVPVVAVRPDTLRVVMSFTGTWCADCLRKVDDG